MAKITESRIPKKHGKRLGIIGGIGAETSSKLCLAINQRIRKATAIQPDILLENVPMPDKEMLKLMQGKKTELAVEILKTAVVNLNKTNVDFIIIPCNTVHIFIDKLRAVSVAPIVSIIEETAKKCKELQLQKIGLLASQTTIDNHLFENVFKKREMNIITPDDKDQEIINKTIVRILDKKTENNDKTQIKEIIKRLQRKGAEAIILGCTDLQLLVDTTNIAQETEVPLIDTCKVLEDVAVKRLMGK
ncbi:amino acid racemase [Candidatus Woesearchaeota archaeon]|nr:amino acid racemase [Candidatus Woesearchaeota archaeon]